MPRYLNVLLLISLILFAVISITIPEMYMDEIFHYSQTLSFHQGNFKWNEKITTPPGLYFVFLSPYLNLSICRGFNVIFGVGLSIVLRSCYSLELEAQRTQSRKSSNHNRNPSKSIPKAKLKSSDELFYLLVILPPSFFFHFLFYTDTLSTLLVMASLLLSKQKRYCWAGIIGLLSLTLRQTNVIWIAFIAGTSLLEILDDKSLLVSTKETSLSISSSIFIVLLFFKQCIYKIQHIMAHLWTFVMAMIAFSGFILWNGGITLGDKTNHIPSLHFPQLFYFSAFTCFFGLFSLGNPAELMNSIKTIFIKKWYQIALVTPIIYYLILKYTISHPFLLADNRHFTFYIWRYVLRHDQLRLLLSPAYAVCIIVLLGTLQHKPFIWTAIYMIALLLTLVPSPLIEFRYFIIPYYIWRLHMKPLCEVEGSNTKSLPLPMNEIIWHSLINLVAFSLFILYPFSWDNAEGLQRFMW